MSGRRVVGFYTDEHGKVRPLTEYGFAPPEKDMRLSVDTTSKERLKQKIREYRERKGMIPEQKGLFHYARDEKQQTMEEVEKHLLPKDKDGKLKVKVTYTDDGYYKIYNLSDPKDDVRVSTDYIGAILILKDIYGFTREELDEKTIKDIHLLFPGDELVLEKKG